MINEEIEKPTSAQTDASGSDHNGAQAAIDSDHRLESSAVTDDHLLGSTQADEQHLLPPPPPSQEQEIVDRPPQPGNLRLIAVIAVLVIIGLLLLGIVPRMLKQNQVDSAAQQQAGNSSAVQYILPYKTPPFQDVVLPGTVQAVQQTAINARAQGYVKQLFVDIGAQVVKGQLLATIETPDLDQQTAQGQAQLSGSVAGLAQARAGLVSQQGNLAQAEANLSRADASLAQARQALAQSEAQLAQARQSAAQQEANLDQAQANLDLATVTNQRYQNLVKQGAIDQETADQQYANYRTTLANVQALKAALAASVANTASFQAGVGSALANVKAYQDGVVASQAAVATARANVDSSRAIVTASQANVTSNQANLERLQVLQGFNRVTAPFSGVITARNVDEGALIGASGNAGSGSSVGSASAGTSTSATPASGGSIGNSSTVTAPSNSSSSSSSASASSSGSLFSEAQLNLMKVYVNIPQVYASEVAPGIHAKVTPPTSTGKQFDGVVARTAGALDPSSRTLVTEIRIPNANAALRPGMFAEVSFHLPTGSSGMMVPDTAIVFNTQNTQVIVVTPDNKLHFQEITVSRDFGRASEVIAGLRGEEHLVATPTDSMREGQAVRATAAPPNSVPGQS